MARAVNTPIDSLNFYVQAQDASTAVLTVVTTATSTKTSADITNTFHKGAVFYAILTTVSATTTVAFNINGKDPVTANYLQIGRVSLDAVTTAQNTVFSIYPGLTGSNQQSAVLPQVFQVVASITATASAGGANLSFTLGMSKVL